MAPWSLPALQCWNTPTHFWESSLLMSHPSSRENQWHPWRLGKRDLTVRLLRCHGNLVTTPRHCQHVILDSSFCPNLKMNLVFVLGVKIQNRHRRRCHSWVYAEESRLEFLLFRPLLHCFQNHYGVIFRLWLLLSPNQLLTQVRTLVKKEWVKNLLTPTSDQHVNSPNNFNEMSVRHARPILISNMKCPLSLSISNKVTEKVSYRSLHLALSL